MIMISCRKFLMAFWLFLISVLCHAASKSEPQAILLSPSATSIERLAADEVQKHIYLRTKTRLPVLPSKSGKSKTAIRLSCDSSRLSPESFRIDRDEKGLHIVGGSDGACFMVFTNIPNYWASCLRFMAISFPTNLTKGRFW